MKHRGIFGFGLILIVCTAISCQTQQMTQADAAAFIEEYESRAEFFNRQLALTQWEYYTEGGSDSLDYYRQAYRDFMSDAGRFSQIQNLVSVVNDDRYRRKLELIHRRHLRTVIDYNPKIRKLTDSLLAQAETVRCEYQGQTYRHEQLVDIAAAEDNRYRREEAFRALAASTTDLGGGLAALARMRNQAAVRLGYNSYFDLMLKADGIDKSEYIDLLKTLGDLSAEPYRLGLDSLRDALNQDELQIWDIEHVRYRHVSQLNPFYETGRQVVLLKNTFNGIDLNLNTIPIYMSPSVVAEQPESAVLAVHIPDDIRIAIEPDSGMEAVNRLFRQAGRALYAAHIDQGDFLLAQSPAPCFERAMARISGNLMELDGWKRKYGGIPEPVITAQAVGRDFFRLYELRLLLVYLQFERRLYLDPYADCDQIYGELFEELMMFPSDATMKPLTVLAGYIGDPVGLQNRVLASCIAAQTYNYLNDKYGSVLDNQHTREFLVQNFYRFGGAEDWQTLLSRGTGERLNPQYYLEYCGI